MKYMRIIIISLLSIQVAPSAMAQVNLPLDASNCAIYNALSPKGTSKCTRTTGLGSSRGLIIQMDNSTAAPNAQQNIATLPRTATQNNREKTPKIDRQAAKSENGYYIHFAFNSETLEKDYRAHLDRLAIVLNSASMRENCVKITGHTDTIGSAKYNKGLSDRRAKSVYNYLMTIKDIGTDRFTTVAAGESQPLPDKNGSSPFNRRVEFSSKSDVIGCLQQK